MSWNRVSGVRGRGWVAVAVGVLLAAGCSDGGSPVAPTPEPSVSETAEPSPTVDPRVVPTRPAEWDQVDLTGAKAVAKYFLDLYDHVYATGDLAEWDALSHPECKFCASVHENVSASWAADERTDGGLIEVYSAAAAVVVDKQVYSVDLALVEWPWRAVSASGEVLSEWSAQQSSTANVLVLREADHWAIRGVDTEVVT